MAESKSFLSVADVALEIDVTPEVVLRWIATRSLIAADVSRGAGVKPRWRIDRRDLEAFIASRKTATPATVARRSSVAKRFV